MSIFNNSYSYHQTTKSLISAFASIFDGMSIQKTNADGSKAQVYKVPIDFAPKNKWVSMINERPDHQTTQVQMTLPRMAFNIVNYRPNMTRKIGFNGTYTLGHLTSGGTTKIMNPTPIDLEIELYAITKDNDDMFQIIEQILPYFQPTLTINFKLLPEFNIYKDIPISLIGIDTTDSFIGSPDDMRTVESTFKFSVPMYYFGPVGREGKIIKDVIVNMSGDVKETYEAIVDPITASENETHTIIETWKLP